MDRQALGNQGEALAAAWYQQNGYQILARNFRTRLGEVDLVARKDGMLVFCEVKTRSHGGLGTAAAAVTPQKQKRVIQAVQEYLMLHRLSDPVIRFDVAEVYYRNGLMKINVIEDAFSL